MFFQIAHRGWRSVLLVAWLLLLVSCNVGDEVDACASDGECARDEVCHEEGRFCTFNDKTIRVGVFMPFAKEYEDYGNLQLAALEHLSSHVNANGGIGGRTLEWVKIDDRLLGEAADEALLDAVREHKVVAVIGGANSTGTLQAQSVLSPLEVLLFSPMATSPAIGAAEPAANRYTFRRLPDARLGETLAASYFASKGSASSCTKPALIRTPNDYGEAYQAGLEENYPKFGRCLEQVIMIERSVAPTYAPVFDALDAAETDCVSLVGSPLTAGEVLIQAQAYPWGNRQPRWLGNAGLRNAALASTLAAGLDGQELEFTGVSATINRTGLYERWEAEVRDVLPVNGDGELATDISVVAHTYDVGAVVVLALLTATPRSGAWPKQEAIRDAVLAVTTPSPERWAIEYDEWNIAADLTHGPPKEKEWGIYYRGISGEMQMTEEGFSLTPYEQWRYEGGNIGADVVHGLLSVDEIRELAAESFQNRCVDPDVVDFTTSQE